MIHVHLKGYSTFDVTIINTDKTREKMKHSKQIMVLAGA